MSGLLRLLACQVAVPPTSDAAARDAHLVRIAGLIDARLAAQPADLVVLPELSAIDYAESAFAALDRLAEPDDGASFQAFATLARRHGAAILYGYPRRGPGGGRPRIAQGLVGADGRFLGAYDKLHLCQFGASGEKDHFEAGAGLLVFTLAGLRLAPIICYDIRIPELARTLCRRHGVQLLLHCGAYYRDESYATWRDFVVARAMENQVWLLSLNRAGADYGGSMLCPPWVDEDHAVRRLGAGEELVSWEIDADRVAAVRRDYGFLADTRDDYADLPLITAG